MSDYDDDAYDKYADNSSGDHAPVVSWKGIADGDGFTGVLLPVDPLGDLTKGHEPRREFKQPNENTNDPGGFTRWPPKNNKQKINTPVSEAKFEELWPDEDLEKARKVWQPHFTFQTTITDGKFISKKTKTRMTEAEQDPGSETRRRLIEQGKDLTAKIEAALAKVGRKPQVGQTWRVAIKERVENKHGGETTIFSVDIKAPDAESKAVVEKYVADAKAKAFADAPANPDDKYSGGQQEDPPF
jgi:hypothetical protein